MKVSSLLVLSLCFLACEGEGLRGPEGPEGPPGPRGLPGVCLTTESELPELHIQTITIQEEIAPNGEVSAIASCPEYTYRTGGGCQWGKSSHDGVVAHLSAPEGEMFWKCTGLNLGVQPSYVFAHVVCLGPE